MEPTVVRATELRNNTRKILQRVRYGRERFLVQTFDEPTAIILNVDEYTKMVEALRFQAAVANAQSLRDIKKA